MTTEPNRLERRGAQRFEIHLPLSVHFEGKTVPGLYSGSDGPWHIFLRRNQPAVWSGGGTHLHHALRNYLGAKYAGSMPREGRSLLFLRPPAQWHRRATRVLSILAIRSASRKVRPGCNPGRRPSQSNFGPPLVFRLARSRWSFQQPYFCLTIRDNQQPGGVLTAK